MADKPILFLENCWSIPDGGIVYLSKGVIYTEFKNNSDHLIDIESVTCKFETEIGLEPYTCTVEPRVSVRPHNLAQLIEIPFLADLSLRMATNSFTLSVIYRLEGSQTSLATTFAYPVISTPMYLIIHPIRPPTKHFFISHKDPENTKLSEKFDYYLRKIGFVGYIAENDTRPGMPFWDGKVLPSIDTCVALIVLWTYDALKKPDVILKEAEYAKSKGKKIIVLAENNYQIPDSFPSELEQVRLYHTITDVDIIKLVKDIERTYKTGGYNGIR